MQIAKRFGVIALFFMAISTQLSAQNGIIPLPNSLEYQEGAFLVSSETSVIVEEVGLLNAGKQLSELIGVANPITGVAGSNAINLSIDPSLGAEAYQLGVSSDQINIVAGDDAGLYYAAQTLRQAKSAERIPAMKIEDSPRFGYRGAMLDVARHFFTVEEVKRFIDIMAIHKLNKFHWHLTEDQGWRIEIKQYPKLTEIGSKRKETVIGHASRSKKYDGKPHGGFYTQDEVREIVAYAAKRYIEVIPEIEMPGHSSAALAAYPELACEAGPFEVSTTWGVHKNLFCPTEETFNFLENVLSEVMTLFPSQYIHIGADEAVKDQWEASQFCQDLIKEKGLKDEHGLQSYFVTRIDEFLTSKGKRLIGWDEILEGGLSPNATVMSWRGIKGGIEAAKQKHNVIMTPTTHMYFDYYQDPKEQKKREPLAIGGMLTVEKVYSYEPIPEELTEEEAGYILGAQANIWTEYISTMEYAEYMSLPRLAALSEVVWSQPEQKDWSDFETRLQELFKLYETQGYNYAPHYKK